MKKLLCIWLAALLCVVSFQAEAKSANNKIINIKKEAVLSALYEADILEIREAIKLGIISFEEITAHYLERISAYNQTYNCFITICDDALEIAKKRDLNERTIITHLAHYVAKGMIPADELVSP